MKESPEETAERVLPCDGKRCASMLAEGEGHDEECAQYLVPAVTQAIAARDAEWISQPALRMRLRSLFLADRLGCIDGLKKIQSEGGSLLEAIQALESALEEGLT